MYLLPQLYRTELLQWIASLVFYASFRVPCWPDIVRSSDTFLERTVDSQAESIILEFQRGFSSPQSVHTLENQELAWILSAVIVGQQIAADLFGCFTIQISIADF